jgi:DNA-binding transcriptional regulator YiaG
VEGTAIGGTTAVEDAQLNKEITLIPKTGVVTFSESCDAVIYNVQGKQVKAVAKTTNLTTSDLAKGLYIVRLNGSVSKKLIVE